MKTDEKIDLFKLHKAEYAAARKPARVEIKPACYLSIVGQGEPGGSVFSEKIGALYGTAFTIKMRRKFGGLGDYAVCKLEAQWWAGECGGDFSRVPKEQWQWKLMIRTPDFVGKEDLKKAVDALTKKGKAGCAGEVALETLREGQCVQMLHVGPYDKECETIAVMQEFAEEKGLEFHGRHHEIYISDPRRVAPEKLKTILREPVRPKGA
jgi:hypothetical protein